MTDVDLECVHGEITLNGTKACLDQTIVQIYWGPADGHTYWYWVAAEPGLGLCFPQLVCPSRRLSAAPWELSWNLHGRSCEPLIELPEWSTLRLWHCSSHVRDDSHPEDPV